MPPPHRRYPAAVAFLLIPFLIALAMLALVEGGWRLAGRIRTGSWPQTRASAARDFVAKVGRAYERHPYYLARGRPGATLEATGRVIRFDAAGRRGPGSVSPKPPSTFRVLCIGGSTTFDLLAADDGSTWPARLAAKLGPGFDVVNAGFPGWTTVESLIALQLRDVDTEPDLVISYSGINDLQPASHEPFSRDYALGHGELLPRVLGIDPIPISPASRLLFAEWILDRVDPKAEGPPGFSPVFRWKGSQLDRIPEIACATFRRNLRSTIAVARAHRSGVLLVAQTARLRKEAPGDPDYVRSWIPGLTPEGTQAGLARFNQVAAELAESSGASFADPFETGSFSDADFGDPFHFSPSGSERFAAALAPEVRSIAAGRPHAREGVSE